MILEIFTIRNISHNFGVAYMYSLRNILHQSRRSLSNLPEYRFVENLNPRHKESLSTIMISRNHLLFLTARSHLGLTENHFKTSTIKNLFSYAPFLEVLCSGIFVFQGCFWGRILTKNHNLTARSPCSSAAGPRTMLRCSRQHANVQSKLIHKLFPPWDAKLPLGGQVSLHSTLRIHGTVKNSYHLPPWYN